MIAILNFIFLIIDFVLSAIVWIVIANAVISWLIAFDVINMRNATARQVVRFLDAVTRPLLRPFRRFIPTLGGIDVSPVILIILLEATDQALLPALVRWLAGLVGAPTD